METRSRTKRALGNGAADEVNEPPGHDEIEKQEEKCEPSDERLELNGDAFGGVGGCGGRVLDRGGSGLENWGALVCRHANTMDADEADRSPDESEKAHPAGGDMKLRL